MTQRELPTTVIDALLGMHRVIIPAVLIAGLVWLTLSAGIDPITHALEAAR